VRHDGPVDSAKLVEDTYLTRGKKVRTVKTCILACYNTMVPYICSEIGQEQKEGLLYGTKTSFVYTHVVLRNWTSFQKPGVHQGAVSLRIFLTLTMSRSTSR
jgi:spermidine dehydrogenase